MFQKPSSSQTPNKFAVQNNRNSNRTQMAAEIKTTAAMPPLTAITGLTHNGRSARYGIKPAHINFRLANTENVCSSVARARLLFLLGPAPSAPSRTQRSRVSARPCPPCNRPWTCHHIGWYWLQLAHEGRHARLCTRRACVLGRLRTGLSAFA